MIVINMGHMFELYENLKFLNLSSYIIKNETDTKDMFLGCYVFKNIEYLYNLDFK